MGLGFYKLTALALVVKTRDYPVLCTSDDEYLTIQMVLVSVFASCA